jgi:hypothetical protein
VGDDQCRRRNSIDTKARKGGPGSGIVSLAVRPRKAESGGQDDQLGLSTIGLSMHASVCLSFYCATRRHMGTIADRKLFGVAKGRATEMKSMRAQRSALILKSRIQYRYEMNWPSGDSGNSGGKPQ